MDNVLDLLHERGFVQQVSDEEDLQADGAVWYLGQSS